MTTIAKKHTAEAVEREQTAVATGAAAAAMVASGIGAFAIGLLTTGAVISEGLKETLNWWNPAGPLTGKTGLGVIVWLISWYILNRIWHTEDRSLQQAFTITLILIGLGLILTFPLSSKRLNRQWRRKPYTSTGVRDRTGSYFVKTG